MLFFFLFVLFVLLISYCLLVGFNDENIMDTGTASLTGWFKSLFHRKKVWRILGNNL